MTASNKRDPRRVFVVHGRDEDKRRDLFAFLRAIGLEPIEWNRAIRLTGKASPFVGEILDAAFSHAAAVVVLLTGDDEVRLRKIFAREGEPGFETRLMPQARPNVLFEAGIALGRHPDRTIFVELGELRPFSDIAGRHTVRLNNSTQRRQDLAERLATAGCAVDIGGRDWHSVGDFRIREAQAAASGTEQRESHSSVPQVASRAEQNIDKATTLSALAHDRIIFDGRTSLLVTDFGAKGKSEGCYKIENGTILVLRGFDGVRRVTFSLARYSFLGKSYPFLPGDHALESEARTIVFSFDGKAPRSPQWLTVSMWDREKLRDQTKRLLKIEGRKWARYRFGLTVVPDRDYVVQFSGSAKDVLQLRSLLIEDFGGKALDNA